jgi:protein-disulfide isomerase
MIIFGDFQCPFCKKQADEVETKIIKEYVETGKVKLAYRDFPLENIHPYARPAAIAAECAGQQGAYWPYHDQLFANNAKLSSGNLDFTALAKTLKLNTETFKTCLKDPNINAEVSKDLEDGISLGIKGTPASFINNTFVEGAYPYEAFKQVIDEELKKIK